jgi:inosine-uridine nucleoside N-ribohydrolase
MHQRDVIASQKAVQSIEQRHKILLDTDIGDDIDDALALALALSLPAIDLVGLTTVFGDTLRRAALAHHILHIFERGDIPIAVGVGKPLQQRHSPSSVAQAEILSDYSPDREKFTTFSGPELIVQQALEYAEQLTLVCIGPLTNVALALLIEPRITLAIRRTVMMGGTSGIPLPEHNVQSDVKAAHIVLHSGIPITLLGLNVTTRCQLSKADIQQLHTTQTPQAQLLSQLITIWQQHRPHWRSRRPYLHDPLTLVALCKPELLCWRPIPIKVVTRGPFTGFMVPRVLGGTRIQAAVGVDAKLTREWIMQRLLS